jgi:hypothetical protein
MTVLVPRCLDVSCHAHPWALRKSYCESSMELTSKHYHIYMTIKH